MKLFLHRFDLGFDLDPFYKLFENVFNEKIELGTFEDSDILIETLKPDDDTLLYKKKWLYTFFYLGESDKYTRKIMSDFSYNSLNDFSCVLKGEKDNKNIINFPLYLYFTYACNLTNKFIKDDNTKIITKVPPKNICVIISNSCPTHTEGREGFVEKLEQKFQIDYAGRYKNNIGGNLQPMFLSEEFIDFVSQYKFIITMENSKNKDYITEKILHGFTANTIPIYWGSDNIHEYFNEERFINVKTYNDDDVNEAIEKISILLNDEEKYLEMVNKPIYKNNVIPLSLSDISNNIKKLLNK